MEEQRQLDVTRSTLEGKKTRRLDGIYGVRNSVVLNLMIVYIYRKVCFSGVGLLLLLPLLEEFSREKVLIRHAIQFTQMLRKLVAGIEFWVPPSFFLATLAIVGVLRHLVRSHVRCTTYASELPCLPAMQYACLLLLLLLVPASHWH